MYERCINKKKMKNKKYRNLKIILYDIIKIFKNIEIFNQYKIIKLKGVQ